MSTRNLYIYTDDDKERNRLADEYEILGRHVKREPGRLIVLALAPRKARDKKSNSKHKRKAERKFGRAKE